MMRFFKNNFILGLLSSVLLSSCAPKTTPVAIPKVKESKFNKVDMVQVLDSLSKTKLTFFYGKISTTYQDKKQNLSFKTSLKINPDSAVTALITYAGIPIINSIITKDSVKYQNKRSKCFTENDIHLLQDNFNVPFEFKNIVELLTGLPVGFEVDSDKYAELPDSVYHIIFFKRPKKIKKEKGLSYLADAKDDILIRYFLSGRNNDLLDRVEIESPSDQVNIKIEYLKRNYFGPKKEYLFPTTIHIKIIAPENEINISLDYEKIEVDLPQTMNYSVPTSYAICE